MEVYILVNDAHEYHEYAFTSLERAQSRLGALCSYHDELDWFMVKLNLPFVGRSICYVEGYYGFNYNFNPAIHSMYNVIERSDIYACNNHAKSDPIWKTAAYHLAQNDDPDGFVVTDTSIASAEVINGKKTPFNWGDVVRNKFNVEIKRIRVIKGDY